MIFKRKSDARAIARNRKNKSIRKDYASTLTVKQEKNLQIQREKTEQKNRNDAVAYEQKIAKGSFIKFLHYDKMYEDGICHIEGDEYSKTVQIMDIDYALAKAEAKIDIYNAYCQLLMIADETAHVQISIINRISSNGSFAKAICVPESTNDADGLNDLRRENNGVLMDIADRGENNIMRDKFFTFTVHTGTHAEAATKLDRVIASFNAQLSTIKCRPIVLNGHQRLHYMHDFINDGTKFEYEYGYQDYRRFCSSKTAIAPHYAKAFPTYIEINEEEFSQSLIKSCI